MIEELAPTELSKFHPSEPRTMRFSEVREARVSAIHLAHVDPLNQYVKGLRQSSKLEVPYFDPADGGMLATLLILLEKPGPMTSILGRREGSGFISRDNDDPTAEHAFNFWRETGLPRQRVCMWNVIPSWNGTKKFTVEERRKGVSELEHLLSLMPSVRTIVLAGNSAQSAKEAIKSLGDIEVFESVHPSMLAKNGCHSREGWKKIGEVWREAGLASGAKAIAG